MCFLLTESRFNGNKRMRQRKEKVTDYSDPFAIHGLLDQLDSGRYGSVTDDIRSLFNRKAQMIHTFLVMYPELANESRGREMGFSEEKCNVIDLDDDDDEGGGGNVASGRMPVVVIDSDEEEESNENRMAGHFQGIVLPKPEGQFPIDLMVSLGHLGGSESCLKMQKFRTCGLKDVLLALFLQHFAMIFITRVSIHSYECCTCI